MPLSPRSQERADALLPAGQSAPLPAPLPLPLSRFNAAPAALATALLRRCCGSSRWAARIVACRPYPDMDALLAAVDEAAYDMTREDLAEALDAETAELPVPRAYAADGTYGTAPAADRRGVLAAHTALRAAHTAYEHRFGHVFVICLDAYRPDEWLDQALASVRSRLGNDVEEEHLTTAEELRRLVRSRLLRLATAPGPQMPD